MTPCFNIPSAIAVLETEDVQIFVKGSVRSDRRSRQANDFGWRMQELGTRTGKQSSERRRDAEGQEDIDEEAAIDEEPGISGIFKEKN